MAQRVWNKPEPDVESIKEYYGLAPEEWTGSLADKVERIMSKDDSRRNEYVNRLLCDEAYALIEGVTFCRDLHYADDPKLIEQSVSEEIDLICYDGTDLGLAVKEALWNDTVLTEDTLYALRRADWAHTDVIRDAEWNLSEGKVKTAVLGMLDDTRSTFNQVCEEARKRVADYQRQSREPVLVGDVLKDWMRSIGRDESGKPINEVTAPAVNIRADTVVQIVASQSEQHSTRAADRWFESSVETSPVADDEFEL